MKIGKILSRTVVRGTTGTGSATCTCSAYCVQVYKSVQQEEATVLLLAVVLLSCAHTNVKLHVLVVKLESYFKFVLHF